MKMIYLVLFFLCLTVAAPAHATTWYVGKGAGDSDGNSCSAAQTDANGSRKATIAAAIACVVSAGTGAGNVVEVRAGTYTAGIPDGTVLPAGTGWGANQFTVRARAGDTVIVQASSGSNFHIGAGNAPNTAYFLSIENFIMDGTNITFDNAAVANGGRFVQFLNNEIRNTANGNGIDISAVTSPYPQNIIIKGNSIHDGLFFTTGNAAQRDHAIYTSGGSITIEDNTIFNITGFGIHENLPGAGLGPNIFRRNIIHNVGTDTVTVSAIVAQADNVQIYNNKIYDILGRDSDGGHGISVAGSGSVVYSNTISNTTWFGIRNTGSNTSIKNNIVVNVPTAPEQIADFGSGTTIASNFCTLANANCAVTGNPLFVNAATKDFNLQSSSTAINAGADLGTPYNFDFAGTFRPQGAGWDMGAFEFASIVPLPTVTVSLPISGCTTTSTSPKACTTSNSTLTITGTSSLP